MGISLEGKGYVKKDLEEEWEERIHTQVKAESNGLTGRCVLGSAEHHQRRDWIGMYAGATEQHARSGGCTHG